MDSRLRDLERRLLAGEDVLEALNLERKRAGLPALRSAPRKPEPSDPDEHPACSVRHAVEDRGWRRGKRLRCRNARSNATRYLKKKAHRDDRRNARLALKGHDAKAAKRYASGRDIA